MNAHFFDLNTLITINSKVWIVENTNPNTPLLRISKHEFNLIKKGVYKNFNTKIKLSGNDYWISEEIYNNLKISCKNKKANIADLAFSMQEFMNPEIIEKGDYQIHIENIRHLKNTQDNIFIICSKNSKKAYEPIIKKLEDKIKELGLSIKKYFFISETFYNKDKAEIVNAKTKLLLQFLIGLKIEDNSFINEEVERYDGVTLYEDDANTIKILMNANDTLHFLVNNTEETLKEQIRNTIKDKECEIIIKQVTFNKANIFIDSKVELQWRNIVRKFESFHYDYLRKFNESRTDIDSICKEYGIENYNIDSEGRVNVFTQDVDLSRKNLKKLPLKFGKVMGNFYCDSNQLETLEGAPVSVSLDFDCSSNKLSNLDGCPKYVGKGFFCSDNNLTSLENSPEGSLVYYCLNNNITNLEGLNTKTINVLSLKGNPIYKWWDLVNDVTKLNDFIQLGIDSNDPDFMNQEKIDYIT